MLSSYAIKKLPTEKDESLNFIIPPFYIPLYVILITGETGTAYSFQLTTPE